MSSVYVRLHSGPPGDAGHDHVIPVDPVEVELDAHFEPWTVVVTPYLRRRITFKNAPRAKVSHYTLWRGPTLVLAAPLDKSSVAHQGATVHLDLSWRAHFDPAWARAEKIP